MKEGYKTSELYVALVAQVIGLLQIYGVFGQEEADAWLQVVTALIAVLPSIVYIWSRTVLKQQA